MPRDEALQKMLEHYKAKEYLRAGRFVLRYSFFDEIDVDKFFWGLLEARKTEMAMRLLVGAKNEEYNRETIKKLGNNKQ